MEKIKTYTKTTEATTCDFCDDGIAEYNCYACGRKLCFFCERKIRNKSACFFHWKLYQAFKGAIEQYKTEEKGGEKI